MTTTLSTLQDRLKISLGDTRQVYLDKYTDAINNASRRIYPDLHKLLENKELITGNILPPFRWSSTSALNFYAGTTATLAKTTTAGLYRGFVYSAKVTVSAANGYLGISSSAYPRLLDLMGKTVSVKVWAYPEVANDATIVIYTLKADGTAQTLTSTTTCPLAKWTLLELEDQVLNDDLIQVDIRLKVATINKYAYFMPPRLTGHNIYDYIVPKDFDNGFVAEASVQTSGYSDDACDDLEPTDNWEPVFDVKRETRQIGGSLYKHIRLPYLYSSSRQIKLTGYCPLESLSDDSDTISLEDPYLDLLIARAKYELYIMVEGIAASEDTRRYESKSVRAYREYMELLSSLKMTGSSITMNIPQW